MKKANIMKKAEEANAYYDKQPEKMHVYDAGESVQNMPVKKTEESHKQCTPGEFGMNKEGQANLLRAITKLAADPRAGDLDMNAPTGVPAAAGTAGRSYQNSINNAAKNVQREQRYLDADRADYGAAARDAYGVELGARAVDVASSALPYAGQIVGPVARGVANTVGGMRMSDSLVDKPKTLTDAENAVGEAKQQFSAAMSPGEKTPPYQPKPVGGVPGFTQAVGNRIANIKMPSPQRMFNATHPRRPFDMPDTPAAQAPAASAAPATPAMPVKASAAGNWQGVDLAKNPINWTRTLPKADATAKNWQGAKPAQQAAPPMAPVKQAPQAAPAMAPVLSSLPVKASAHSFGTAVKRALLGEYDAPVGGGAALGAIGGGLMGAMNPGEEEEYDDRGNVIGKKRKSRLGAALGGAMAGGAAGGALGAGAKYFGMLGQDKPLSLPTPAGAQTPESPARVQLGDTGKMTPKQTVLARQPKFNRYKASPEAMSYNDAAKAMDANPFTPVQ